MNYNVVSIRLSKDGIAAYRYLQAKEMKPARILKEGGEPMLIERAIKYGLKQRLKKLPF